MVANIANIGNWFPGNSNLAPSYSYGGASYSSSSWNKGENYYIPHADTSHDMFLFMSGDFSTYCGVASAQVRASNSDLAAKGVTVVYGLGVAQRPGGGEEDTSPSCTVR